MTVVDDINHIQIIYDSIVIRIYYTDNQFYVDHEAIKPKMFKKAYQAKQYLSEQLKDETNIDVRFFYSTTSPIEKKMKLLNMVGWYNELDVIYKSLLLLID